MIIIQCILIVFFTRLLHSRICHFRCLLLFILIHSLSASLSFSLSLTSVVSLSLSCSLSLLQYSPLSGEGWLSCDHHRHHHVHGCRDRPRLNGHRHHDGQWRRMSSCDHRHHDRDHGRQYGWSKWICLFISFVLWIILDFKFTKIVYRSVQKLLVMVCGVEFVKKKLFCAA